MAQSDTVQTTIVADSAWRAEVLATTALLADADASSLLPADVWCRIVRTDGSVDTLGTLDSISMHDTTLEALHG